MGCCLTKPTASSAALRCTELSNAPQASKPDDNAPATTSREASDEYTGAITPVCELDRRQHLLSLNVMYKEPERRFDDITRLCTMIFKVPIALVSLLDENVQWFLSAQGLPGVKQTQRSASFCAWTLLPAQPQALVVEDALVDARFSANPLVVGPPGIRFYAGCPLVCSNGMRLGSLCIIDTAPREFDAESCHLLANVAEMVVREIEKDTALQQHSLPKHLVTQQAAHAGCLPQTEQKQPLRAINSFTDAIMLVDVSQDPWRIAFANEVSQQLLGLTMSPDDNSPAFWSVFKAPPQGCPGATDKPDMGAAVASQQNFELLLSSGQLGTTFAAEFRCASHTCLDVHMPLIGIPSCLPSAPDGLAAGSQYYFATLRPLAEAAAAAVRAPSAGAGPCSSSSSAAPAPSGGVEPVAPLAGPFCVMRSSSPFDDIKLGPLLGRGSFGRVYRGTWANQVVAVKVMEHTSGQGSNDYMLEGLLSQQMMHPHIVRTYRYVTRPLQLPVEPSGSWAAGAGSATGPSSLLDGKSSSTPLLETWLVLEFCNRGCVVDAVSKGWFRAALPTPATAVNDADRGGQAASGAGQQQQQHMLDIGAVLATAREIASALAHLHGHNILHGDLTGSNVLLTSAQGDARGFTAKVSDFGLSCLINMDAPVIETSTYGTVTHMPPELLCEGRMSKAVDVYSFGVVLWELLAGCSPYAGMSYGQVLHRVALGHTLRPPDSAPAALKQLLNGCLAKDPEDRPGFAVILTQLLNMEARFAHDGTV